MTSPQEHAERIVREWDRRWAEINESIRAITEEFRKLAKAEEK